MGNNCKKFTDRQLLDLTGKGLSQVQIAEVLNVGKSAICQRLKRLRKKTTAVVVSKAAVRAVNKQLRVMDQLYKINSEANILLDQLENDPGLKIKCLSEIRAQLAFQVSIFESLFSAKEAANFQEVILSTLAEIDPLIRDKCIEKLNSQQSLRQSITWD